MGGGGSNAPNQINSGQDLQRLQNTNTLLANNSGVRQAMDAFGSGQMSLADALNSARGQHLDTYASTNAQGLLDQLNQVTGKGYAGGALQGDGQNQFGASNDIISMLASSGWDPKAVQSALQSQINSQSAGNLYGQDLENMFASDPMTGTRFAEDQLKNSDLGKQYLSMQDRLNSDESGLRGDLAQDRDAMSGKSDAFQLQPEDYAAYGQASGNIARMFGGQEQSTAQALADRGLGAGPNGMALSAFAGLQGNKNEMLSQAQQQIAQSRIDKASQMVQQRANLDAQRMAQTQGNLLNLQAQGAQAVQDQYGRNMTGINRDDKNLLNSINAGQTQQQMAQNQANEQFAQQQQTRAPSFGEVMGMAGMNMLGQATGSAGSNLGNQMFPSTRPRVQTDPGNVQSTGGGGQGALATAMFTQ